MTMMPRTENEQRMTDYDALLNSLPFTPPPANNLLSRIYGTPFFPFFLLFFFFFLFFFPFLLLRKSLGLSLPAASAGGRKEAGYKRKRGER